MVWTHRRANTSADKSWDLRNMIHWTDVTCPHLDGKSCCCHGDHGYYVCHAVQMCVRGGRHWVLLKTCQLLQRQPSQISSSISPHITVYSTTKRCTWQSHVCLRLFFVEWDFVVKCHYYSFYKTEKIWQKLKKNIEMKSTKSKVHTFILELKPQ